ncbi:virulence-associated E family protein [Komagataeibacter europaeus]|uniref:virulence-associated E family protein n=1 Tax=Komagataeibacter europaeus TaxID=33995 RepID=UPI001EE2ED8A|nr:virulence-associated E family protein [Komagataeibacter europaeus]
MVVVTPAGADAPASPAWMDLLARGAGGRIVPSLSNCLVLLGHDARLRGMLAWDEFSCRHIITRAAPPPYDSAQPAPGPYPRPMEDMDAALIQAYLQRAYDLPVSRTVGEQACRTAAMMRRTHPVREWLDGLRWDGTPRLGAWLHHALGCADDAYHAAVGARFLCAAVRRVRSPGCKFDYVPVLEGRQGMGKSRLLATLFGTAWFKDDLPRDLGEKDAAQGLLGVWGVEMAELQALGRSSARDAKAFFSRQHDRYRPTYGAFEVTRPRQCVFAGTTNEEEYLTDPTGNRRYWPVTCAHADVAWVEKWRAQLWAEADHVEATSPMPLWLENGHVGAIARQAQDSRMHEDVWRDPITAWLRMGGAGAGAHGGCAAPCPRPAARPSGPHGAEARGHHPARPWLDPPQAALRHVRAAMGVGRAGWGWKDAAFVKKGGARKRLSVGAGYRAGPVVAFSAMDPSRL